MSKPSLVTRFTRWVHTLPLPARTFYFALLLLGLIVSFVSRWIAGALPTGPLTISNLYDVLSDPITIVGILAIYYYLDDEIAEAVDQSRDISKLSDEQFARLKYELVVIPLWPHLAVSLLAGAGAIQGAMQAYGFHSIQPSNVLLLAEWALGGGLFFGFAYRVIRLIVLSGRFYAGPLRLSLYNLPPIYELSGAVGKAALFQLLFTYPNVVFNVGSLASPLNLGLVIFVSLAPFLAFLVPQAVLSRRLAREKTTLIVGVQQQLEAAFDRLRGKLERANLSGIEPLQAGIESLLSERRFIESIPTWPWRLGTFRIAVTAVLLPVFVWLIQQVLNRFLPF